MKSPWRVTMQYICGKPQYAVYRLRDVSKVDHSGNRESGSTYMDSKEEAERIAAELNAKEEGDGKDG